MKPAGEARGEGGAARDGVGVAVDGVERAVGGGEDGGGVAATTEGAVAIGGAGARGETRQHLPQHHRDMARRDAVRRVAHTSPPSSSAANRASSSASFAADQIWK